jgi:hypothetical protein
MRLAILLFCVSAVGFAGNWSGYLVDSRCWASETFAVAGPSVGRDMNMEIRYCSANARTKKFAVVLNDWGRLTLDSSGNRRACALVQQAHKGSVAIVNVRGVRNKNSIKVESISGRWVKKPW